MKVYSAEIGIDATPEAVWSVLTDLSKYPDWDPNMIRTQGTIGLGEKITVYTKLSPNRAFKVKVTELIPPKRMVWTGGMPLGLFKGVRSYELEPTGDVVKFRTREEFSGLLLPLIGRLIPNMNQLFREFAAALKQKAEGGDAP